MHCKAEGVLKNFRYRILTIDGKYYILDADKPFVIYLFPFIFWILPHTVYQIDKKVVEKLRVHNIPKKKFPLYAGLLGVGFGYPISKLITSIIDYFNIPMDAILKTLLLTIIILIMITIRIKISMVGKKNLLNVVLLYEKELMKIRIWPRSINYVIKFPLFSYLLFGTIFTTLSYVFWLSGNLIILLFLPFSLFLLLMVNVTVVFNGDYSIKLLKDSKRR